MSFFYCLLSFSQDDTNEYVQKFPEKVTIRLGLQNTSNSFSISDATGETSFIPNDKTYLGISFLFRSVELDFGYAPDFFSENKDNKGSKLLSLNFRMFLGKWMQTLDLYKQKGFFTSTDNEIEYIPGLKTFKIGGSTNYIFNPNFSFRAIGFQNEWQKKSAGSFIPSLTFYYTNFRDEDNPSDDEYSYDLAIGPGYYYNWVIKKHFILSAGGTLGFGVNFTGFDEEVITSVLVQTTFRIAIGYNSERFFTGINSNLQVLSHDEGESLVQDNINFIELYLGYRFKAPKKWIEKAAKANRTFGLD